MTDYRRTEQELWDEDAVAEEDRRAQVVPSRVPPTPPVNDIAPARDSVESLERFIADPSPLAGPSAERRLDAPSRSLAALSLLAAEDIEAEALDDGELKSLDPEPQGGSARPPPLPTVRPSLAPASSLPSMMLGPTMSTRGDATERITTIPQTHPLANSIAPGGSALSVPPPTRRRRALRFQMALGAFALLAIGASASRFLQSRGEHHAAASAARGRGERSAEPVAPASTDEAAGTGTGTGARAGEELPPAQETALDLPPLPSDQEIAAEEEADLELGHDDEPEHEPAADQAERARGTPDEGRRGATPASVAPEGLRISVGSVKLREGGGRAAPDRAQVAAALNALTERLRDCVGDEHGIADVTLTVRAPGVVSHALVEGPFAGSDKGTCIARMLRSATLPRFAEPVVRIEYPFEL